MTGQTCVRKRTWTVACVLGIPQIHLNMDANTTESVVKGMNTWDVLLYVTLTIMCVVFLIIMAGNVLTIVVFIKFHSLRTVRNYFLVSLAAADTFIGLVTLQNLLIVALPAYYVLTLGQTPGGSVPSALSLITIILSYLHILVITLDCFICILKPLHYHQIMSPRRTKIIIAAMWIGSILLGGVYLVKELNISVGIYDPYLEIYNTLMKIILWVVVVLAVIIMYLKIFLVVHKQRRQIRELSSNTNNTTVDMTKNKRRSAMIFVIIIAFIVLWIPHMICSIMVVFYPLIIVHSINPHGIIILYVAVTTLALCNSAVNAFIYARFDKDFRNAYRQVLKSKWISLNVNVMSSKIICLSVIQFHI